MNDYMIEYRLTTSWDDTTVVCSTDEHRLCWVLMRLAEHREFSSIERVDSIWRLDNATLQDVDGKDVCSFGRDDGLSGRQAADLARQYNYEIARLRSRIAELEAQLTPGGDDE